ncbi:MAG: hypothetical protein IPH04_17435 [Saprospirales bacterium]|nr:hypothetical protein [Saprospirales bacterium]
MKSKFNQKAPNWPTDAPSIKSLERLIELGEIGQFEFPILPWPFPVGRYLVTFMSSNTSGRVRSGTVVSVTNQSRNSNRVVVSFFRGFSNSPETCTFTIPAGMTADFATRDLPNDLTVANALPTPELTFHEGRAIVSSVHPEIAVSSRVYYTSGANDEQLLAISDSKIVAIGEGNRGD